MEDRSSRMVEPTAISAPQYSPAFLAFSLNASTPQKIEIPRTKDDIKMDEQLSLLFEFLSTLKKPPEPDETTAK
ncbi:hypothetical protein M422DRAFT_259250 [Sphaerobolus stellatus SS14]|uniref:Uncharacterized protein n=1 Tax=Sphaerobolus stellatus (strain SS14) TaxID=990650 RepID=A0A0C9UT87_SPHS4|nr:hypothetical protein M422DRAFT_259250 [Sphaerobolus stellatus SS14]